MARPMPTTKAHVSGYKFLRRRVEHGLVLGDIRMIHDPLAKRRRALVFGIIAVAFLGVGSGLMAWLQPNPNPGDAPIVRTDQGQFFVLVNEAYHPVANLTSARLIVGEPATPHAIGTDFLGGARLGAPLGIADAPNYLADPTSPHSAWAACYSPQEDVGDENLTTIDDDAGRPGETIVVANADVQGFTAQAAALVESGGKKWLLTEAGRVALPADTSTQGRVLRRALGLRDDTYAWKISEELLNAFAELPPLSFPAELPEILDTGDGLWARSEQGVAAITPTQAEMLVGMGAQRLNTEATEVAALGDAPLGFNLPSTRYEFHGPDAGWLCANDEGGGALSTPVAGSVAVAGESAADRFVGLEAGGVGVDSGHGYHVISATGLRHAVSQGTLMEALGTTSDVQVPWEILRLLPEGSPLERDEALRG